jgi:Raf kinase inhibitor-like YbhB/YbcL family protein
MKKLLAALVASLAVAGSVEAKTVFQLKSADFANGSPIPSAHEGNSFGCTGRNLPPTLSWSGAPAHTRSFAFTVVDPDAPTAGGFVHWIVYNIPASRHTIGPSALKGTQQGRNDAGINGYFGPCPPPGSGPHHYHFTLYALNIAHARGSSHLNLSALRGAMKGHVLKTATLIGTFQR